MITGKLYIKRNFAGVDWIAALLVVNYLGLAIVLLQDYVKLQSMNFILGLMAFPFVVDAGVQAKFPQRYLWWLLLLLAIGLLMPVSTFLYFALAFAIFYTVERYYGRANFLAVITIGLMSPVFQYFLNTFSFPIRLKLTEMAGYLFNLFNANVEVEGNLIIHNGNEFSVDPGCMGLKMMETSLLLGVMLIGFYQRRYQRKLNLGKLVLFFAVILALNVTSNLFRIVLLVQFNILPESMSHELAGIVCLFIYVFVPAIALASFLSRRSRLQLPGISHGKHPVTLQSILLHLVIVSSLLVLAKKVSGAETYRRIDISRMRSCSQILVSEFAPGILKLRDENSLVYIKYIRGFFDTDHNPMICWKGSGYVFEKISKENWQGSDIYLGELVKGDERLYSAWWYSNGKDVRISQVAWRWDMIKGANAYALVNVTCLTKEELEDAVAGIINNHSLVSILINQKIMEYEIN